MLPFRSQSEVIAVWHFHLRQTLGVHDLVLPDDAVLEEEIGSQRVHLIGLECAFFGEWHGAIDVIPNRRRVRRVKRHHV